MIGAVKFLNYLMERVGYGFIFNRITRLLCLAFEADEVYERRRLDYWKGYRHRGITWLPFSFINQI